MAVKDQLVAQEVMGLVVGSCMGIFYSNDGMVVSRDPGWLQGALNMIIGLFRWYRLVANFVKSKSITCHLGALRSGMSEEAVGQRCTVRGVTYQERPRQWIPCPYCGVELTAVLVKAHRRRMHGIEL